jgi:branched-chain amino acid transport system substrate-binding protein
MQQHPRRIFFLHYKWYIALLEIASVVISLIALIIILNPNEKNIYIAAVVPQNIDTGKSIKDALDIYSERINKYDGINGYNLRIIFYDDQGDVDKARAIANTIVKENKFIAVIGHFSDQTTQAAGEIYHNANIPIISPISNIKPDKKWRFQLSPTRESYGIYMAHYIKSALKKDQVSLIRSNTNYDKELVDSFSQTFFDLGGEINKIFRINQQRSLSSFSVIVVNF